MNKNGSGINEEITCKKIINYTNKLCVLHLRKYLEKVTLKGENKVRNTMGS
jgi:hypothetical protein